MTNGDPTEPLVFTGPAAWRAWLDEYESTSDGVWILLAKKGKPSPTTVTYDTALDEALCSGWIDGQGRSHDDASSVQRFTPRRARSTWSVRNQGIVAQLIDGGRMRPRGQAEIDRAKADGRWDAAYAGSKDITVPAELVDALAANPRAAAMFEILSSQNRFSILFRLHNAKRPETVTRNVAKYVDMLARGETIHPQKRTLEP